MGRDLSALPSGLARFGRFAFPPNRLGYCGPEDHAALLHYVAGGQVDPGLLELGRRFSGAYPYLRLIASENAIRDAFDARVVDAYWVGNRLLDGVGAGALHDSLETRFRDRMGGADFTWLAAKLALGARPHHNFHVFDVYTRAGLMGDAAAPVLLQTMDQCRVSWGTVREVLGDRARVSRQPLVLAGGRLALGEARDDIVAVYDARGARVAVQPGDVVAIHWGWACDVLAPAAAGRLRSWTARSLALANLTI